jgi:hypothetical protein
MHQRSQHSAVDYNIKFEQMIEGRLVGGVGGNRGEKKRDHSIVRLIR